MLVGFLFSEPLVALAPDHALLAVQLIGCDAPAAMLHDNTTVPPDVIVVGDAASVNDGATAAGVVVPPEGVVVPPDVVVVPPLPDVDVAELPDPEVAGVVDGAEPCEAPSCFDSSSSSTSADSN